MRLVVTLVVIRLLVAPSLGDVGLTCFGPKDGAKNHSYCHVTDIPSWCCQKPDKSVYKVRQMLAHCLLSPEVAKGGEWHACSLQTALAAIGQAIDSEKAQQ